MVTPIEVKSPDYAVKYLGLSEISDANSQLGQRKPGVLDYAY